MLGQADPGLVPPAFETRQIAVAGVGDGEERQTAPFRRHHLDFEPFPDRHAELLARRGAYFRLMAGQAGDGLGAGAPGLEARVVEPSKTKDSEAQWEPTDAILSAEGLGWSQVLSASTTASI